VLDELQANEEKAVENFFRNGCGCSQQCHTKFRDILLQSHLHCPAMDYCDSDHVKRFCVLLMGSFNSCVCDSKLTLKKQSKHKATDRVLTLFQPTFRSIPVCTAMFLFGFSCSKKVFKSVKKQFLENGVEPNVHGNVQMTAKSKAFDAETVTSVMTFILNYAEQFGHLFLTMPNSSDLYHQEGFQHSTMLT